MGIAFLTRRIWREQPVRFGLSVGVLAGAGLLEGVALASIVPLLQLVAQPGAATVPTGRLGGTLAAVLGVVGLKFTLSACLMFIVILVLFSQLLTLAQAKIVAGSAARFEARLRFDLYEAITEADWSFFVTNKASDLTTALMHETVRAGDAYKTLVQLVGTLIMVVVYLGLALALSWPMTLMIGVTGTIVLLVLRRRVAKGSVYGRAITDMAFNMWSEALEHIGSAKTVKAYSVEDLTISRYRTMIDEFTGVQYRAAMNQGWLRFWYESISMTAVFLGIYVAVTVFHMSIAFLVVFLLVFYRISPRISGMQALQTQVLTLVPALATIDEISSKARAAKERTGATCVTRFAEGVVLDHIGFRYSDDVWVLHDVSLSIPKGKSVAIVGPSGSGKTTIVDLLLGVLNPTVGSVRVDGASLSELDVRSWRDRIGYVAQDSSFFHDTVEQNIRFGCADADDAEVQEAARLAFADEFISRLPEGYRTVIGDRGVRLSGGQRQRLALARAIVRKPDILVLDEATSALDAESEEKIQRAVDTLAKKMTIVTVTHRLATVRNADVIHFLENGRLVESGSWEQLIANAGRFSEMQAMQSLS